MKRESRGIDNFCGIRDQNSHRFWDQGLKFCLKYLDHSQKHTPRYDPDLNFNLKTCNLTMSGKASFIIRSCQLS